MPLLTCIMAFHAYFRWMQGKLVEERNKKAERGKEREGDFLILPLKRRDKEDFTISRKDSTRKSRLS